MASIRLDTPLQFLKGVGPAKAEVLSRAGLHTVRELLGQLPRRYLDRTTITPIAKLRPGISATVIGRVRTSGVLYGRRRRFEVMLQDESGAITLTWFAGFKFLEKRFPRDQIVAASGLVSFYHTLQILHPEIERLDDDADRMVHAGRIIPIYGQSAALTKAGISSRGLRVMTTQIFESLAEPLPEFVPETELRRLGIPSMPDAIRWLHYPPEQVNIELGRRRLAFEELLRLQYLVQEQRGDRKQIVKKHRYDFPPHAINPFLASLPFRLTDDQRKALGEIQRDLRLGQPMARLLQGDVGCGKTVVAIAAAVDAARNGLQSAFMAPTEILAQQHLRSWREILESIGISAAILTAATKSAARKSILSRLASGDIQILLGTHALLSAEVQFRQLGLVVIDEQHRFGVEQRAALHSKGDSPDLLVMTATPIPRTLALTLYGDLEISTIRSLPPGRKPVKTVWRTEDVREKVFTYLAGEIEKGGQAYLVYPLIEADEESDLLSLEEDFAHLKGTAFGKLSVGLVHSKIKATERDETLQRFRSGEVSVLMATTVIEVGLDNPNANFLVIEHAERFGLAQLHQLRGRVGRGERGGTVVAIAHPPISEMARKRLDYFAAHTDGFQIAEADLELRGPGELFGQRQSGIPELRTARLSSDLDLLEAAKQICDRLVNRPELLSPPEQHLGRHLADKTTNQTLAVAGG